VTVAGRLTIIGGGVMGLMTAYYAAPLADAARLALAVQRGTVYDIGRFTPARFAGEAPVTGVAS
jgi:glycine/D-amino acid oxidase-like deaminating enzyme